MNYPTFYRILFGISSGILSDILPSIYSVMLFGIFSDMYSGILSGILSDIYFGILSGINFGILSNVLSVTISGTWAGILTDILFDILCGILSGILPAILSGILPGILSEMYSDILCAILFDMFSDNLFAILSGILFDIISDILIFVPGNLSDINSHILFGISNLAAIFLVSTLTCYLTFFLACVRVRVCPNRSGARPRVRVHAWAELKLPRRFGPAHVQASGASLLHFPLGAHSDHEQRRKEGRREKELEGKRVAPLLKTRDLHLAGGKKIKQIAVPEQESNIAPQNAQFSGLTAV